MAAVTANTASERQVFVMNQANVPRSLHRKVILTSVALLTLVTGAGVLHWIGIATDVDTVPSAVAAETRVDEPDAPSSATVQLAPERWASSGIEIQAVGHGSFSRSVQLSGQIGLMMNGVVLLEHIRHVRHTGSNQREAVVNGTMDRLRPVLTTASCGALGFVPMALSGSAGAEVQRPLATVVIGGLITSTILTLLVLPTIYRWFEPKTDAADESA